MRMAGRILVLFISSISLFVEGYRVVREANSDLAVEDPTEKTDETDPADFELPDGIYMLNSTDGCYRDAAQFPPGDRPGRYWRGNDLCWSNLREILERYHLRREAQVQPTGRPNRLWIQFHRRSFLPGATMYWPFDMAWYVWKEYSSRYSLWDEPWGWNVTDPATPFQVRMCDGSLDKHEKLYDAKGQYRDWLQLVLESAIVPDGTVDSDGLKCVKSACTDTDIYTKQQYYLQRVPSGDLFPILGTGRPNGTKTVANKYHFLGKWMAKAYVMQEDGFAPATFHRFIYDSIVAGEITKPQVADHYQENDAIEDPDTGKYVQDDWYVPLYRAVETWESLNVTWGSLAPNGSEPSDLVPLDSAREYTQQKCLEVWNRDVVEPVEAIVKGFREMIPAETFWKKLKGASQLKRLIEGSQEVDVDNFLARVVWQGPWSEADRQVMEEVMRELHQQGSGLPILKKPLSILLHYITGSSTEPVHAEDEFLGESLEKIVFVKAEDKRDICHLPQSLKDSHLWVAAPCLMEKSVLMEILDRKISYPSYPEPGEQFDLLGFDDVLLAALMAGESRERVFVRMQPLSKGLRGLAQAETKFSDNSFAMALNPRVERSGKSSIFQEMCRSFGDSMYWHKHWTLLGPSYSDATSDVSDGLKKEWLQLVLESAVLPSKPADPSVFACLNLTDKCKNLDSPVYFLESLPSGDVIPIIGHGKLGRTAELNFYSLGQWIARAYILDPTVFASVSLHPYIYESLAAGKPKARTMGAAHYSEDDTIEECEWLVSILGNRRLEDVGPYGWKSCNEVQDAITGKYVQDACYAPLYRSAEAWNDLDIKWGAAAPNGVQPSDSVPYKKARAYTERNCRSKWETELAEPVSFIIRGFQKEIPKGKTFWKKLQERSFKNDRHLVEEASQLKRLIEGSQEVDVDNFLARVVWHGPWSEADRQVMEEVMRELHQQGSGLPIREQPLSKLLRYITGSVTEPVPELEGFVDESLHKITFVKADTDDGQCHRPLSLKNNSVWIAAPCLKERALLMEQLRGERLYSPKIEEEVHLPAFNDLLLEAENAARIRQNLRPFAKGLRGWAQRAFESAFADRKFVWERMEVDRHGNTSVFQQTFEEFLVNPDRFMAQWEKINFAGEAGIDYGGLKKEWLQLVLETAVVPDASDKPKENLECLLGECENNATVQYFLETLPSGDVLPIMHSGHGHLSTRTKMYFRFIGGWMAKAYVIEDMVFAPLSFHNLIYKSLIAGAPAPPQVQAVHYSEDDTIKECEWLVAVSGSRRPQEVGPYGWQSCDGVQDPETGNYTVEGCYKPLYRAGDMWEWLYNEWGRAAPDGVEPSDLVPFERAREYTERNCRYLWETDFAEPVQEIVSGFRTVVGSEKFWNQLKGESGESKLKELIEGSQEIDFEAFLAAVVWDGSWSNSDKDVFKAVLGELRKEGEGKAMLEKPLNRLLRFFTGAYKAPLKGWASAPPKFQKKMKPRCEPLTSHTCFNTLEIPTPCLEKKENLMEMMKESIAVQDFGQV